MIRMRGGAIRPQHVSDDPSHHQKGGGERNLAGALKKKKNAKRWQTNELFRICEDVEAAPGGVLGGRTPYSLRHNPSPQLLRISCAAKGGNIRGGRPEGTTAKFNDDYGRARSKSSA